MTQPTGTIYEVRWNELCPWLILVKALRASLLIRVLAYAWVGLLLTQWGWTTCEQLTGGARPQLDSPDSASVAVSGVQEQMVSELAESSLIPSGLITESNSFGVPIGSENPELQLRIDREGPLLKGWSWLSSPFVKIFENREPVASVFFRLLCGIWAIAVWALVGGAIARIAARYLTREEVISPIAAGKAALAKWPATVGGPAIVLAFAAALTIPLAFLGLLIRADFLAMISGLLWVFALAWGLVLALVLVALWIGWPLMWATIAVERSDAFDAASRTASYVYQRPVRLAFYVLVASLIGMLGQLIVTGFVLAGIHFTDWAVSWGSGTDRIAQLAAGGFTEQATATLTGSAAIAERSIRFWNEMLAAVAAAYPLAFLFSSCVAIYLLLRLQIDSTEMDEIVTEAGEEAGRMPELRDSAIGIPVADQHANNSGTRPNLETNEVPLKEFE